MSDDRGDNTGSVAGTSREATGSAVQSHGHVTQRNPWTNVDMVLSLRESSVTISHEDRQAAELYHQSGSSW